MNIPVGFRQGVGCICPGRACCHLLGRASTACRSLRRTRTKPSETSMSGRLRPRSRRTPQGFPSGSWFPLSIVRRSVSFRALDSAFLATWHVPCGLEMPQCALSLVFASPSEGLRVSSPPTRSLFCDEMCLLISIFPVPQQDQPPYQ